MKSWTCCNEHDKRIVGELRGCRWIYHASMVWQNSCRSKRWERQTHLKIISKLRGKSMSMSGLVKPTSWVSYRSSASFPQPVAIIYLDVPKRSKQTQTPCWWFSIHAWDDLRRIVSGDWNMLKPYFWDRTKADWRRAFQKNTLAQSFDWLAKNKKKTNQIIHIAPMNWQHLKSLFMIACMGVFIWYWGTGSNHLEIN